jgi:virginiamycin B lyase
VQGGNFVGRLVPTTGAIKLAGVPTVNAKPYGIVVNSAGIPFFAEFGSNKLASIDPNSLAIKEYSLPNANSRPRRLAITSDDIVWYTDYPRGRLGRLDPKTGHVREWRSPGGEDSGPYGITVANDVVWYSESGPSPNTLVRFDPRREKFESWDIPSGGGVVRHMVVTKEGNLVLAYSGVDGIGLVEVK